MDKQILMIIKNIVNTKTDIALDIAHYDELTVIQFKGQKIRYVIHYNCLNTILDIMDNLKNLGYEVCTCINNATDITAMNIITMDIITIIIKKPANWDKNIYITSMLTYTEDNIEPETVDGKHTGNILLKLASEKNIIITFNDINNTPVRVRLNTMLEEPSYGIIVVTDNTGYKEIKLFNPNSINFDSIQRLKDYSHIIWLMTLIAKYM